MGKDTLDWTCGGCGGDECRIEEVEEKKALPVVGFFSSFSTCEEMVRALEAQKEKTEKDEPKVEEQLRRQKEKAKITPRGTRKKEDEGRRRSNGRSTKQRLVEVLRGCFRVMPCRFMSDCDDCRHLACDCYIRCVIWRGHVWWLCPCCPDPEGALPSPPYLVNEPDEPDEVTRGGEGDGAGMEEGLEVV